MHPATAHCQSEQQLQLRIRVLRRAGQRRVIRTMPPSGPAELAPPVVVPRASIPTAGSWALRQPGGPEPGQPRLAWARTASSARRPENYAVKAGPDQNAGRENPVGPAPRNARIAHDRRTQIPSRRQVPAARAQTPWPDHEPGWAASKGPELPAAEWVAGRGRGRYASQSERSRRPHMEAGGPGAGPPAHGLAQAGSSRTVPGSGSGRHHQRSTAVVRGPGPHGPPAAVSGPSITRHRRHARARRVSGSRRSPAPRVSAPRSPGPPP